jgi:hypothetical protein
MDLDPGGPKTYRYDGSGYGFGSATLLSKKVTNYSDSGFPVDLIPASCDECGAGEAV